MNNWLQIQDQQKSICDKFKVTWTPVDLNSLIAYNGSIFTDENLINGLRHPSQGAVNGWYLWGGGEIDQTDNDFFRPIHVRHLINQRPVVLKYLGLPPGWRFQIDYNGYEDIWFDKSILHT